MIYPWQASDWARLMGLRSQLPHALLLHGHHGIGKQDFARQAAHAWLCETPLGDGQPCGQCCACGWMQQGNHPDFRLICPDSLAGEANKGEEKDAEPESMDDGGKKTKNTSREIRIEQIRQLIDFANVGTHRDGLRVILLYPLEALNLHAANALLKTLEEPPPATLFLLVADRTDGILPTILSRCRKFPLQMPEHAAALDWLKRQGIAEAVDWLAEAGGAPLQALRLAQSDDGEARQHLLAQLARGATIDWLGTATLLQKHALPALLDTLQRWACDLQSSRLTGKVRYYPRHAAALQACAGQIQLTGLHAYMKQLVERRRTQQHPLAVRMVLEGLLLEYCALFNA